MGFEQEAYDELVAKVWCHRSDMQREVTRGSHGEHFVIRQLAVRGAMTPSQIADSLRVSSGRVSTVLSALEKRAWSYASPIPTTAASCMCG